MEDGAPTPDKPDHPALKPQKSVGLLFGGRRCDVTMIRIAVEQTGVQYQENLFIVKKLE